MVDSNNLYWDSEKGELLFRGYCIRRVQPHAHNVRRVLEEFQVEGWPEEIYDPLPYMKKKDATKRLKYTIRQLNGYNNYRSLHFVKFHTQNGDQIYWKLEEEAASAFFGR